MGSLINLRKLFALSLAPLLVFTAPALAIQKNKSKGEKPAPRGTPVLWRAPADIVSRDLFWGPGGEAMRPDLRRVTFVKEETGGYSTKYRVRDASGRVWVAKVGKEAQSETAAVRLLWAAGYPTEINYLVPRVRIPGKGTFENVRFEARPAGVKRLDEWKWEENPFTGTREFQGLKVLMLLLNNWDIKDENNVVLYVPDGRGAGQLRYVISDLGATFGKSGGLPLLWRITRSRNEPGDYEDAKFVDEVENGYVDFHYTGKKSGIFKNITVADARWAGRLLSRLSDRQIGDAFRAANYTPAEVRTLTRAVRERIRALVNVGANGRVGR